MLLIQIQGGILRMCIDYRALNKLTVIHKYTIVRIDDVLDRLQGFSLLDLISGYHQIWIMSEDVPQTAFSTTFGRCEVKVLSFSLTNAPAAFKAVTDDMLRPYIGKFVLVYLEGIMVFSETPEEHAERLRICICVADKSIGSALEVDASATE